MILYIDVLFLENVIVNYGILQITEKLSGCYSSGIRKFISAIIGAVYLVIMLLCPAIRTMYTVAGKLLLSVLMIAVAFPFREMKSALKALLSFYISSFIFAGAGYALMSLTNQGIYFKNGEFYNQMKSDTLLLVLTLIFGFLMVRAFTDIFRRRVENESYIVKAYIHLGERMVCLQALIDTGNSLMDPVTQYPVMIAELDGVKELLPAGMTEWLKNWSQSQNTIGGLDENSEWQKRIRLIPFHAIGTDNGMLPGFKPDSVCVEKEEYHYERTQVVVCICQNRLSTKNQYKAIISPEMVSA
ncbi:MAG: sigma-E processing peptidase SpoIIGA [Clostridiaceae bacterium]|nr:sigma-E processing peptidase SpoIIGA [Clostridiaceae bacterium]